MLPDTAPQDAFDRLQAFDAIYLGAIGDPAADFAFMQYLVPELERDGVELMIQEAAGPGRRFRTAPLELPYGRGVNLQIACGANADPFRTQFPGIGSVSALREQASIALAAFRLEERVLEP